MRFAGGMKYALSEVSHRRRREQRGEAAGPVVKDIIKVYYDKKNKKTQGQYTAESKSDLPGKGSAGVIAPRAALKPEDSAAVMPPARASAEPQR